MNKNNTTAIFLLFFSLVTFAQKTPVFTKQDTLRGSITKERSWWNLLHYDLKFDVNPKEKSLHGSNTIRYKVLNSHQKMQIDLQPPMKITKVTQADNTLDFNRDGNVYYIDLQKKQNIDAIHEITIDFEGKPKISKNPPWDDGMTWKKDRNGKDFIATSCQGGGASIWWPNKDHMYDEPDEGLVMSITAPKHLVSVANGRLIDTQQATDSTKTYTWKVVNPINSYGVNINIGDYVHFSEKFQGEKGVLDCEYYVLSYNLDKAKKQFKEVPRTLKAFEHWFGPYPFYEDSFKLVEVPYLGMEHQSSVTYGNKFGNGYLGSDLSGTGVGLKFDYIIIHESGHEWFANNITYKDMADMWIHESFTTYSESLFADYHFGKEDGAKYVEGQRRLIRNDKPMIGFYDVNKSGSGDVYFKGANMLHTLRQIVNDDEKWRNILRGLNKDFYHKTVTTKEIEDYVSTKTGLDLHPFFNQYLRTIKIPVLEYKLEGKKLKYRFSNVVANFSYPIKVTINNTEQHITPTSEWKTLKNKKKITDFSIDKAFYATQKESK